MPSKALKRTAFVCLFTLFLSFSAQGQACTIFTKQKDDLILAGNNEDWNYSAPAELRITSSDEQSYGRLCFYLYSYVQGGMNEKGLFYDGATCPMVKVPHSDDKPTLGMDAGEVILSKCADVNEVIDFLESHNLPSGFTDHLLFADASGNSLVVEWDENDLKFVMKEAAYQIATNFWLSNPDLGGYPCERYNSAKALLENESMDISVDSFSSILESTAQNWGDGGTKYSSIYDLQTKEVYLFLKGNFNQFLTYSLPDELGKLKKGETLSSPLVDLAINNSSDPQSTPTIAEIDAAASRNADTFTSGDEKTDNPRDSLTSILVATLLVLGILGIIPLIKLIQNKNASHK